MRTIYTTLLAILSFAQLGFGQIIPDLMSYDNYRPYLSEDQKKEQVTNNVQKNSARTSQELYPHLYSNITEDHLSLIRGTKGDPKNAFKDYSKTVFSSPTNSPVPSSVYNPNLTTKQKNLAIYEADLAAYNAKNKKQERVINDAINTFKSIPDIKYSLGTHNGKSVVGFVNAYSQLQAMLIGKQEIDFAKAVFLVESAYDQSLTWKGFSEMFNFSKTTIERLLIQDGLDPIDNMAKIMSTFKYMADTTEVFFDEREKSVITMPMLYDYEDYGGKKDATKIFVSKLLRTGTGQCMSLPMLYFLFAKSLGITDTHIALAPEHSFIMFKDNLGNWNNIELTGRMFTTDDFQWQGGFVKANQVKSGIYLNPLTDKETIAYLLTTLTLTYIKSFGTDDRAYQMALTAKDHFPNSLTANSIIAGYYKDLFNNVLRQYNVYNLTQNDLDNDKNAQKINDLRVKAIEYLFDNLGYAKIPDWHYKAWLSGVNEAAKIQQHIVKRRQLEHQLNR